MTVTEFLYQLDCYGSNDIHYVAAVLELVMKLGYFPKDVYQQAAASIQVSEYALRKGISRIAPDLWKAGSGIFHKKKAECPKPKTVLKKMVATLSEGKIIC